MQARIENILRDSARDYLDGKTNDLKTELKQRLWTELERDFFARFHGQETKLGIDKEEIQGEVKEEVLRARLEQIQGIKRTNEDYIKSDKAKVMSAEVQKKVGRSQDVVKLCDEQIKFLESAIKICESADRYANHISAVASKEEYIKNKEAAKADVAAQAVTDTWSNRRMTATIAAEICASYALMATAAVSYIAILTPMLAPIMLATAGVAVSLTPPGIIAATAVCLFSYAGSKFFADLAEENERIGTINVERKAIQAVNQLHDDLLNPSKDSRLMQNVEGAAELIQEVDKELKAITVATKDLMPQTSRG